MREERRDTPSERKNTSPTYAKVRQVNQDEARRGKHVLEWKIPEGMRKGKQENNFNKHIFL